jgi:ribosomal protein L11 methyltransferase
MTVLEGEASLLKNKKFDVIIANINRNILLEDIKTYTACLNENGSLFLSGFYKDDIPFIAKECELYGLKEANQYERNNWVALQFKYD